MSTPHAPQQERPLYAIGIVLFTYFFFTLCDTAAKWLVLSGIPPLETAFIRYLVQLAFMAGLTLPRVGLSAFKTQRPVGQIVRATALLGMTAFNFFAVLYLPLTVTSTIMFGMPLLITALSVPFLGETVGWRRWVAILTGFGGIVIIVQPWGAEFHWAVFLSLCCILSGAVYYLLTRTLTRTESTLTMQLYGGLVGAVLLLPFAVSNWVWPDAFWTWVAFFGVGLAAMTGHQIAIVAHRFAPASTLAPFGYTQIIWMSLSSWLIFAQPPDIWVFVGAPIVVGSGLYIWLRERELAKKAVRPVTTADADLPVEEKDAKRQPA
ncbi:DMT family transporter [Pelagibacterium xiamenense]|uniref:DMT family transporter n=1 Tax=Pelagibacterium xiamenense TaxID=2901140 RepID=UPI001E470670|nr:DMT family transporter [Pelagibacterium xiamenense]MCD7059467.1 DMT family transporter [Pelagibacterium xiamenense]